MFDLLSLRFDLPVEWSHYLSALHPSQLKDNKKEIFENKIFYNDLRDTYGTKNELNEVLHLEQGLQKNILMNHNAPKMQTFQQSSHIISN